ncbi:MAG: hypothetical protein HYU66_12685, partial [Armatimonadetes bacterium]|nr:hypothetical protein [Armatimonadota bacterium]
LVTLCVALPPEAWFEQVVPLPREAAVAGEAAVPPAQLALVAPEDSEPPVAGALDDLVRAIAKAGAPPLRAAKPATGPAIVVTTPAALGDAAGALRLPDFAALPWPEQAYAIRPRPQGGLYVVAPGAP